MVRNVRMRNVLGAKRPDSKSPAAKLPGPKCQGAKRPGPKCQGVKRTDPKCQGVKRPDPKCQGAKRRVQKFRGRNVLVRNVCPKSPGAKTLPEPSLHDCETSSMIVNFLHSKRLLYDCEVLLLLSFKLDL